LELHEDDINQESSDKRDTKKIIIIVILITFVILAVAFLIFFLFRKTATPVNKIDSNVVGEVSQDELVASNLPEHDRDRDGILDEQEAQYGTSDSQSDTDWDGIPDKIEIEKWGTDPTNSDTDGDGFSDGFEIIKGFNPNGEGKL